MSKPGTCCVCGCTEKRACPGGCAWADDTLMLCTRCAAAAKSNAIVLALDPSLSCTGWAVVCVKGPAGLGKLVEAGRITPDHSGPDAAIELHAEVRDLIAARSSDVVIVETPAAGRRAPGGGSFDKRSVVTLPSYGMAVGVCLAAALEWAPRLKHHVMHVPADEWCRGLPSTRGDKNKSGRVRLAASLYGRDVSAFGAPSTAGNVADAVLLARWAMERVQGVGGGGAA